jgi:hypothetical protein
MRSFAVIVLTSSLATPAFAGCDDEPLPTKVTYDNGVTATVVARTADTIHTREVRDEIVSITNAYAGVFVTGHKESILGYEYSVDYSPVSELPTPAQLVPGAHFRVDATRTYIGGGVSYAVEVEVVGKQTIEIGGCPYPVLEIYMWTSTQTFYLSPETTFVHMPSMLTLRRINRVQGSGAIIATTAIAAE